MERGEVITSAAVRVDTKTDLVLMWGGYGPLTLAGETYTGIGHAGLVTATGGSRGSAATGLTLTLSGVDPDAAGLIAPGEVRDAPVTIWRLIFDGGGAVLLDASVYARGRCDRLTREETPGRTANITVNVETAAMGLGRRSGRMRTDPDQRLITPADGGLKHVSYAGQKTLYLGGKPPAQAGQGLPGTYGGGGRPLTYDAPLL
jgi:hypothetical protein